MKTILYVAVNNFDIYSFTGIYKKMLITLMLLCNKNVIELLVYVTVLFA